MRKVSIDERKKVVGGWVYSQTCSKCNRTFSQNYYGLITYLIASLNVDRDYSVHYCY